MMWRWILAAVVVVAASGCENLDFSNKKQDAQKRWFNARSRVLYRLAKDHFSAGNLKDATHAVRQALALQPDYFDARVLLSKIDIEQGRYSQAVARLRELDAERPNRAELAYLLGVALEKAGKPEEALADYRRAYALDETDLSAVKAAAEVLVSMGHVQRARAQVESYLSKAGEDAGMYELAGRLAEMTRDSQEAAEYYQRARDLDPGNAHYVEMLARAQYQAGRYALAAETLTDLMARRDHKAGTWAWLMLGDCHLASGQAHKAFDAYFTASEQAPEEPGVWVSLSRAALAMGDAGRSVLAAKQALLLAPDDPEAAMLLGYAQLRGGDTAGALGTLKAAAIAHPRDATVRCILGRAHAAAGNLTEAIRAYTEALRIDPDNTLARRLLRVAEAGELSRAD